MCSSKHWVKFTYIGLLFAFMSPAQGAGGSNHAVVVNSKLYFKTYEYSTSGSENKVWEYDGTDTSLVKNFGSAYIQLLVAMGDKLIIAVQENSTYKFMIYDGSTLQTGTEFPTYMRLHHTKPVYFDNKLYYYRYNTGNYYNYYLYSYDGTVSTSDNTFWDQNKYVSYLGTSSPQEESLILYNSRLYFVKNESSAYWLYYFDGTEDQWGNPTTTKATSLGSYWLENYIVFDSKLYYTTYSSNSYNLYAYDGTSTTTTPERMAILGSDWPSNVTVLDDKLYYSQYSKIGYFDGDETASAVADLYSFPENLTAYKGQLVFSALEDSDNKLKAYDGSDVNDLASSADPPEEVMTLGSSSYGWLHDFTVMSDVLYYLKGDAGLWKYQLTTIAFSTGYPYTANLSNTNLDIKVKADKDGKAYYVVLADAATAPSAAQVKAATDASGTAVTLSGNTSIYENSEGNFYVEGLTASTSYDIYVVAEDNSANLQSDDTVKDNKIDVTTTASASAVFTSGYPSVTIASDGTTATLTVRVDKDSEVYYVVLADGSTAPSSQAVHEHSGVGIVAYGSDESLAKETVTTLSISGLTASTDYDVYVVLEYNEILQLSPTRIDISTDVVAPAFANDYPAISNEGQTSFTLKVKAGEAGTAYYVVLADGATRPDTTKIKAGDDASGTDATASGNMTIAASVENTASITGLTAGTGYDVWVTAEDANGNITTASKNDVTTLALPKKLTVKQDGSGDYSTISAAISAASSSTADTVLVYAGTYQENVNFGGKNLVVRSDTGAENTIITPSNNGLAIVWFYSGEPSTAKLIGFTLKDGGALQGSALNIETSSSPTIENCIITNSQGYPVRFYNSASVIKNILIYGNTGDGVFYFDNYTTTSYPEIINCTVANNTGYGIQNAKSYKPTVTNSILYGNSSGGAFGNLDITYSIVEGTYSGTGNKSSNPLFMSSTNFDITNYSPAIGAGTSTGAPTSDISDSTRGSPPDVGAYENSRASPLTDTDAPTVSHVREGTTGDLTYIGTATQISAHWSGSDAASGIKKYEYAVDTSATTITGTIKEWTSAGTDTSATIGSLSLVEGKTYYVSVRATDKLDNVSDVVTSNGVKIDITAPTVGSVVHGTDHHLHWLSDTSSAKATWSGFSDGASGIKEYEVLLRDTLNNKNIVDWTNVGLEMTYSFTALALLNNGQYYLKVRASDEVGNLSHVAESSDFQVDNEKPVVTTLFETMEGKTDDIDWFALDDNIIHRFAGTDNGAILQYEFAIGTTDSTDDIIAWAVTANDSSDTTLADAVEEGKLYYTNLKLKDKADNLGDIFFSDGFRIDGSPPESGQVSDGDSEDIDFSESTTSTIVNWSGFSDNGSGISHYLVSLGATSGGKEVRQPVDVGNANNYLFTGLSLEHGVTYYSSVAAVDSVGNESINVSSDGFTMDVYPGPPRVASSKPDETTFLSLINGGHLVFKFSEPVESADLSIYSKLGDELQFERIDYSDSIAIALSGPLTSLDTIQVEMSQLTDESGRVGNDTLLTFYNEMIADYNHDTAIDASDLSMLVTGWTSEDYFYELGPVEGEAPYFVPIIDLEYDLRDLMAFTRMWHWYHGTPQLLNLARVNFGDELDVTVNDKSLTVTIPEHVIAGQLAFQVSDSELSVTLPEEKTGDVILLSHTEAGLLQSVMDFAYFNEDGERKFVLPLEYGRHSSTLTLSYALYGKDGVVTGQGVVTMDVTPVPAEFVLNQNYPNPFNPTTQIEYGLPVDGQVKLTIYDLLGQEVKSLVSGLDQSAGYHNIMWNARDNRGLAVSAGVYIFRLVARGEDGQKFSRTKKMVLLK